MSTFITVGRSDHENLATNLVWSKQIEIDLILLILFSLIGGKGTRHFSCVADFQLINFENNVLKWTHSIRCFE